MKHKVESVDFEDAKGKKKKITYYYYFEKDDNIEQCIEELMEIHKGISLIPFPGGVKYVVLS